MENKRQAEENLALQHADIVYANGKKKFTDITFYIEMLSIVDKFDYANSIQQSILCDMREKFQHEEIMWHNLAQRELNGLATDKLIKLEDEDKLKNDDTTIIARHSTLKKRIEMCVDVYEEAVKMVIFLTGVLELGWCEKF